MSPEDRKIFCIGFNKTGTTSLHQLFKACGLNSVHNTEWCHYSYARNGKDYFTEQCYTDGEQSHFIQLEKWFPGSLFILNTRDLKSWLYSRIKHVMRHNEELNLKSMLLKNRYGKMAKDFFSDETSAIQKWILDRKIYHEQVRAHFDNQKSFRALDITNSTGWTDELISFLEMNNFKYSTITTANNIHKNKRTSNELKNKNLIFKYFKLVDELVHK